MSDHPLSPSSIVLNDDTTSTMQHDCTFTGHIFSMTVVLILLCCAGERLGMVEAQCERVRMLYRDCARPPPPPLQTDRCQVGVAVLIDLLIE